MICPKQSRKAALPQCRVPSPSSCFMRYCLPILEYNRAHKMRISLNLLLLPNICVIAIYYSCSICAPSLKTTVLQRLPQTLVLQTGPCSEPDLSMHCVRDGSCFTMLPSRLWLNTHCASRPCGPRTL